MARQPNIYKARHRWNGEIYYFPALLDGDRYTLPFNNRELRIYYDLVEWAGTLSDMKGYKKYHTAKKRAQKEFGYSMVAAAVRHFGRDYQHVGDYWISSDGLDISEDIPF